MNTYLKISRLLFALTTLASAAPFGLFAVSEFTVSLTDDGLPIIRYLNAPIVRARYVHLNAENQGGDTEFKTSLGENDAIIIKGGPRRPPGINWEGTVSVTSGKDIKYSFVIKTEQAQEGMIGGGIEFEIISDSAVFKARPPIPTLVKGKNPGWRWVPAPGRDIAVSGESGIVTVNSENAELTRIRVAFYTDKLAVGETKHSFTITLPKGWEYIPPTMSRYDPIVIEDWHSGSMRNDVFPVDLRFLNDAPAGKHGSVIEKSGTLVFEDGTPARFWGTTIGVSAVFATDELINAQAKRIAQMGFNLVRFSEIDMNWSTPCLFAKPNQNTTELDPAGFERIDAWVKALREQGVYSWLEISCRRQLRPADNEPPSGPIPFFNELGESGRITGFCYLNPRIQLLMKNFQNAVLTHVNPHTGLSYATDPAIAVIQITHDNDITQGEAWRFRVLPRGGRESDVKGHLAVLVQRMTSAFKAGGAGDILAGLAEGGRAPRGNFWDTMSQNQHVINGELNAIQYDALNPLRTSISELNPKQVIVTVDMNSDYYLHNLPVPCVGGLVSTFGEIGAEALSADPRYETNWLMNAAGLRANGKPYALGGWRMNHETIDRCTAPLYIASVACLQDWDSPVHASYLRESYAAALARANAGQSYNDPAALAMMPAAALAYRRGDVKPAKRSYRLELDEKAFLGGNIHAANSQAVRTLVETSKVSVGLPKSKLSWLPVLRADRSDTALKSEELGKEFSKFSSQNEFSSDTGELTRNPLSGYQLIDAPRIQAAQGFIGGEKIKLKTVRFIIDTKKAAVCISSLTDDDIRNSKRILISFAARAVPSDNPDIAFVSEPVVGTIQIQAPEGLALYPLLPGGSRDDAIEMEYKNKMYTVTLTKEIQTHWLLME